MRRVTPEVRSITPGIGMEAPRDGASPAYAPYRASGV